MSSINQQSSKKSVLKVSQRLNISLVLLNLVFFCFVLEFSAGHLVRMLLINDIAVGCMTAQSTAGKDTICRLLP